MATKKTRGKSEPPAKGALKEFRKTNEAIGLRVSEGRLSLLSRKILNIMVYHAQRIRVKGMNAPINTEAAQKYYWIPLSELARDAAYDSKDIELLKQTAEELQNIRIFSEDAIQWTSERLVASVKFVNPRGLKQKGGMLWFGYAFPPEVESMVMSPGSYTKLSVYYQALLRSGASLALYEICRRYATNPTKVTNKSPWEWWYGALTGNPVTEALLEYKYFKRDVLKPAIAEINMVTDINVELIEHKLGRKVSQLQFKVMQESESPHLLASAPVIDGELVRRMMAFGLSQEEACNILATTEDAVLRATIDFTEKRLKSSKAAKVDSPAGYFKQALRNGYVSPTEVAKKTIVQMPTKPSVEASIERIKEKYLVERAKDAFGLFNELTKEEQDDWLGQFKESIDAKGISLARGLSSTAARTAFSMWFACQQWQEPTAEDLLAFAATGSVVQTENLHDVE